MKKTGIIIGIAFSCVIMGALIGALTNMVNGVISPLYFQNIMRWHEVEHLWRACITQGIFEGT